MDELELYEGLKKIAVKQLGEMKDKGSMTVSEAEAAKTAMCLINMFDDKIEDAKEMQEYSERGRSYAHPYRRYNITSYDDGRSMRSRRSYNDEYSMHDDYDYPMRSYRDESYDQNRDSRGRYSSHSIDDRIVSTLERMIDSAESDYERKRVMEYIRYVRSKEQTE